MLKGLLTHIGIIFDPLSQDLDEDQVGKAALSRTELRWLLLITSNLKDPAQKFLALVGQWVPYPNNECRKAVFSISIHAILTTTFPKCLCSHIY
jgi:hypothetical protein